VHAKLWNFPIRRSQLAFLNFLLHLARFEFELELCRIAFRRKKVTGQNQEILLAASPSFGLLGDASRHAQTGMNFSHEACRAACFGQE
jgi:hypothetical protein